MVRTGMGDRDGRTNRYHKLKKEEGRGIFEIGEGKGKGRGTHLKIVCERDDVSFMAVDSTDRFKHPFWTARIIPSKSLIASSVASQ